MNSLTSILDVTSNTLERTANAISSNLWVVYHRCREEGVQSLRNKEFVPGNGAMYGRGLYTTYDKESQLSPGMVNYGPYLVKLAVRPGRTLCFDKDAMRALWGTEDFYEQVRKMRRGPQDDPLCRQLEGVRLDNGPITSKAALYISKLPGIESFTDGLQFTGNHDGRVHVLFRLSHYTVVSVLDTRTGSVEKGDAGGLGVGGDISGLSLQHALVRIGEGKILTDAEIELVSSAYNAHGSGILRGVDFDKQPRTEYARYEKLIPGFASVGGVNLSRGFLEAIPESFWESFGKGLEKNPGAIQHVSEHFERLPASAWISYGKGLENGPNAIRFLYDHISILPESAWESFGKGLEKDPSAIQYVKSQLGKLPTSGWESFGKGLEKDPGAIQYIRYQLGKLPASGWESFGKGLGKDPSAIACIDDQLDKLPASGWESFGKGLEKDPSLIQYIEDDLGKLPASGWESFGKGLEKDPSLIQDMKDENVRSFLIKKDIQGLMRYLKNKSMVKQARVVNALDRVASVLESRGMLRQAAIIDSVSNSLESSLPRIVY